VLVPAWLAVLVPQGNQPLLARSLRGAAARNAQRVAEPAVGPSRGVVLPGLDQGAPSRWGRTALSSSGRGAWWLVVSAGVLVARPALREQLGGGLRSEQKANTSLAAMDVVDAAIVGALGGLRG